MNSKSNLKPWLAFLYLGILGWGASFMWIKIALREIGPFNLVLYRVAFGMLGAWGIVALSKQRVRLTKSQWGRLTLLGLINSAIPMTLISAAEIHISSGLAGMLNGCLPLMSFIMAHYFLPDEKFTPLRVAGLAAGFTGMFVLLFDQIEHGIGGTTLGVLMMIAAITAYSSAGIFLKLKLQGIPNSLLSACGLTASLLFMLIATPLAEGAIVVPQLPLTWLALAWMGILGMTFAFQALYYLFHQWGVTRTSMVTYVFPVTAVILGFIFLEETITWKFLAGGALVILGIALVSKKGKLKQTA
jgi:drug/metabolite transporter (DMT)-like permease